MHAAVVAVLGPPELVGISDRQARGAHCLWCDNGPLTTAEAVDLGEHKADGVAVFPRACRRCAGKRAHRGMYDHHPDCETCRTTEAGCEIGRALYRLVREGRR
ncbi:hypothetical protein [Streptomyces sp. SID10815]|uniref:hypothetical protein n=1 Tax=Streptomyces sp. SID10815 TaxID=2706027 RepID=UPI0013CA1EEA|nr:hypothetical protein [Streptomyces sp. SID10815]NEA51601.1 hypothetical protein [Streptomyces sp. SID10815]